MRLDNTNKKLLGLLQIEFPLTGKPYASLGLNLGITEDEVIQRIGQLKLKGLVRQISPVLDARSIGYKTTLVAMRVAGANMDKAGQFIMEHPGISHGYERNHYFNLWLTLAVPGTVDMETELKQLADLLNAEAVFSMPAIKVFKLRTYFNIDDDNQPTADSDIPDSVISQKVRLSPIDRRVINELQQDLPLVSHPFAVMSTHSGIDETNFLALCQSLLSRGIMRRFGAAINHRGAGFAANAMTCWVVPTDKVETVGNKLASLPEVSHCYERQTNPLWHHNLFVMIHGRTKEACQEIAEKVSVETGFTDYVMLLSVREFKKTRITYLV
ncbi:Lrp/AsnC family transcriptional regulator [Chloroflexota bacterium]